MDACFEGFQCGYKDSELGGPEQGTRGSTLDTAHLSRMFVLGITTMVLS